MPTIPRSNNDPIGYLIKRRYPFAHFTAPPISLNAPTRGADFEFAKKQRVEAEQYRAELAALTPEALAKIFASERQRERDELAEKLIKEENARFFNLPSASAPYEHYCMAGYWTLDECVALSLGKNPKIVNWKSVSPYLQFSPFAMKYERFRDLTERAKWAQQLFEPVYPSIFLAWAKEVGFPVCNELLKQSVNAGISLAGWKQLYEDSIAQRKADLTEFATQRGKETEKFAAKLADANRQIEELKTQLEAKDVANVNQRPLETRERENLQLISLLGAIRGYGYEPVTLPP